MARLIGIRSEIKLFLTLLFILTSTACTRAVDSLSVNVSLPVNSSKSTLGVNGELDTLIVNLHNVPEKPNPWVHEFSFRDKSFEGFVEIKDVPAAPGIIVQVLGLYKMQDTGGTRVAYGGEKADLRQKSEVTVTLKTQNNPARMAEIAGRYLNTTPPHPTGTLVAYYHPKDGFPAMKVWESAIVDGWFRAMALEETSTASTDGTNAGLSFVVESPGVASKTIFHSLHIKEDLPSNPGTFLLRERMPDDTLGVISVSDTGRVLISKPQHTRVDGNGDPEPESAQLMYMGFFGVPVDSSYKVCYPTVHEALPRAMIESSGNLVPLEAELSGSVVSGDKVKWIAGGYNTSFTDHYSYTSCDPTDPKRLLVRHRYLGNSVDEAVGLRPPFYEVGLLGEHSKYIEGSFDYTNNEVTLKWQNLPGVSSVQGFDLFYRPQSLTSNASDNDNDSDHDDVDRCQYLIDKGFRSLGQVTTSSSSQYSFGSAGGVALTANNWNRYDYAVCAYTLTPDGTKKHIGNYIRSSCLGSHCGEVYHAGWATEGPTEEPTSGNFTSSLQGGVTRVQSVSSPSPHMIKVMLDNASFFLMKDEVLFTVHSEGNANSCGIHNGENIEPGHFHFARVIEASTGYITVLKGSWLDSLTSASASLSASPTQGSDHCFIQAVRVPHFRNLTLNPGVSIAGDPFHFDSASGGVIAFRVNGELKMEDGSSIDATATGYPGGSSASDPHGSTYLGLSVGLSHMNGAQGAPSSGAGGGGGGVIGPGGNSYLGALGGDSFISITGRPLSFSLGGGGGFAENSGPFPGQPGGGAIFVVAEKYTGPAVGVAPSFKAEGGDSSQGTDISGGGGGGSVNVLFKKTSGLLSLSAAGGDGGSNNGNPTTAPGAGGNGGGGFIQAVLCDLGESGSMLQGDLEWITVPGAAGNGGSAGSQPSDSLYTKSDSEWEWFCKN